mgnify:CR=1 FL=1
MAMDTLAGRVLLEEAEAVTLPAAFELYMGAPAVVAVSRARVSGIADWRDLADQSRVEIGVGDIVVETQPPLFSGVWLRILD